MTAQPASAASPPPEQQSGPTLLQLAASTFSQLRGLIGDTLGLAALEARLAALSLFGIVAAAVAAAFALLAFWLTLQATLVLAFMRLGADPLWLMAGFTLLNGLAIALCLMFIRRLSGNLKFKATAAAIRGSGMHAAPEARNPP